MKDKHPRGIAILFFTEMWERFSYYGMRAILFFYLIKHLKFSESLAGNIYGAYTGLVYFTPLIGGYIADNYLGYKKSILIGGIFMMFGHLSLALDSEKSFFIGLALLILGNGFFKPNISTLLGFLYEDKKELKDSGYTLFYMGINIGGTLGPLLCGYIGETYSWHYGFGLAGIGMFFGLIVFWFGQNHLAYKEKINVIEEKSFLTEPEKSKISAIAILSIFTMFFWFAFEQAGSSMNLFTEKYIDRKINLFGIGEIPASTFQSLNGIMILLFAPFFAYVWNYLNQKKINIYTAIQFFFAFFFLGIGFLILVLGSNQIASGKLNILYIILPFLFHTFGELCISPVGLSTVSKLAPIRYAGLLMGFWFISNAISHYVSGFVSGQMNQFQNLSDFFMIFVYTSILAGIVLLLLSKKIYKLMRER